MNLLNRLLIWLRLKCPCSGWLSWKQYSIHVADVSLSDGTEKAVHIPMRPCKKCGMAVSWAPRTVKLKKGKVRVATVSGCQVRTYIGGDDA